MITRLLFVGYCPPGLGERRPSLSIHVDLDQLWKRQVCACLMLPVCRMSQLRGGKSRSISPTRKSRADECFKRAVRAQWLSSMSFNSPTQKQANKQTGIGNEGIQYWIRFSLGTGRRFNLPLGTPKYTRRSGIHPLEYRLPMLLDWTFSNGDVP